MEYPAGWYFQATSTTDSDALFSVSQNGPGQLLGVGSGGGADDSVSFAVDATSSYGPGVTAWISPEGYNFSPTTFNFNGFIGDELISGETSTNAFEHIVAYKILPSGRVLLISWFRIQGGDLGNTYSYEQYFLPMISSFTVLNKG